MPQASGQMSAPTWLCIKNTVFIAGRTGGHINPCLTYAHYLKTSSPHLNLGFISTSTPLDYHLINSPHISAHRAIGLNNLPNKKWWLYPLSLLQLINAFIQSFVFLWKLKAQQVVTTGGFIAFPACLAAYCLRIPIILVSLDAYPGKAIQVLSRLTSTVYSCFAVSDSLLKSVTLIEYPLTHAIIKATHLSKQEACEKLGISPQAPTILILGGSQGSQFINELTTTLAKKVTHYPLVAPTLNSIQLLHQTGKREIRIFKEWYHEHKIKGSVFDYTPHIGLYYAASDIIIARAGAGTLFEIAAFKKKALIIPLVTTGTSHQKNNAAGLATMHPDLFTVLDQSCLEKDPELFYQILEKLLIANNPTLLATQQEVSHALGGFAPQTPLNEDRPPVA